jgi:hypothetical protein
MNPAASPAVVAPQAASRGESKRWLAAVVMMVAVTMDLIDVTIVNVALPTIRRDLAASATQLEPSSSGSCRRTCSRSPRP